MKQGSFLKHIPVVVFWLFIWQMTAHLVHNSVLLAGPLETVRALFQMASAAAFWKTVASSCARILCGLAAGSVLGICAAVCGFRFSFLHTLLSPLVTALKSVPVACFVVMLLLWAGKTHTTVIVTAIVVFPLLYFNTYQGLLAADPELSDIAALFTMTDGDRIRHIYLPALFPYLVSAFRVACGMCWKSGVAAEVIALENNTLGNSLNTAKTLLQTDRVFAVTLTVVLLSVLTEKLLLFVLNRLGKQFDYG